VAGFQLGDVGFGGADWCYLAKACGSALVDVTTGVANVWGHFKNKFWRSLRANIRETVDPLEFSVQGGEGKAA
jgi:hypothetical protein